MDFKVRGKRGQVTIFIIIAIIIVALIIFFFYLRTIKPTAPNFDESDLFLGLKDCSKEAIKDEIKILYENGGILSPYYNISYQGNPYNYLCYTSDFGLPCYNRHPMLEELIEKTLKDQTLNDIRDCFDTLRGELESRGYQVSGAPTIYSIDIIPGQIRINLKKDINITKEGVSRKVSDFSTSLVSSAYEILDMTREIVNSEVTTCNFPRTGFSLLYPNFDIDRIVYMDSKLYEIIDTNSNERIKFAIRSCVHI